MNWTNVIQDLIDAGMTQAQIAEKCNTGQSHISSLLSGDRKSPNWILGDSILRLHKSKRLIRKSISNLSVANA